MTGKPPLKWEIGHPFGRTGASAILESADYSISRFSRLGVLEAGNRLEFAVDLPDLAWVDRPAGAPKRAPGHF